MTLCTSTLSSIIPPSILIVIAGSIANVSIGTLLVAGLVPGLFIALRLHGVQPLLLGAPRLQSADTVQLRARSWYHRPAAILPMLTPVILLVGIVDGYFTPTEAAGDRRALHAVPVGHPLPRRSPCRSCRGIVIETARTSGTILFIAATAKLAAWVFTLTGCRSRLRPSSARSAPARRWCSSSSSCS